MLVQSGCRLLTRRSLSSRPLPLRSFRASMSSIYVVPVDPNAPSTQAVPDFDSAKLWSSAATGAKPAKVGTTRVFYNTPSTEGCNLTALASLGDNFSKKDGNERRELVRKAVGSAVKQVKALGDGVEGSTVYIDASADAHAAGKSCRRHLERSPSNSESQPWLPTWRCTASPSRPSRPLHSAPTSRSLFQKSSHLNLLSGPKNGTLVLCMPRPRTLLGQYVIFPSGNAFTPFYSRFLRVTT